MINQSISTFLNGAATMWFAVHTFYLLTRKHTTRLMRLLGVVFAFWTVTNLKDIILSFPGMYCRDVLDWVLVVDGWSAVTFACFIFELTMPGWVTLRHTVPLALPFALFTAVYALWPLHGVAVAYTLFISVFGIAVLLIGYVLSRRYKAFALANYSNIDEIDISWIIPVYALVFFSQFMWLLVSLVGQVVTDLLYYLSQVVMWQVILHYSSRLRPVRMPHGRQEEPAAEEHAYAFAGTLERIVEERQLYLNPNLSLADLTAIAGTNRTYLSAYFSNVKQVSFYDYINALRIEKVSRPMIDMHPEYTFEYVARQSGFNSMSTFRRAFTKFAGVSPGQYRAGR